MPKTTEPDIYSVILDALYEAWRWCPFGRPEDFHRPAPAPDPAKCLPATEAKIEEMSRRYNRREQLFSPADPRWPDGEGPAWRVNAGNFRLVRS